MDDSPLLRKCGTPEVHERLMQTPEYQARQMQLAKHTASFVARVGTLRLAEPLRIDVVVHVVFSNDLQNISDEQVQSQITVLNSDFAATNADRAHTPTPWLGLVASADVRFRLATTDPAGKPTSGITRTRTTTVSFGMDDGVKSAASGGADPWPADKYLNIWVCNLTGGILGYAEFPGSPPATDGVVILYKAFGTMGTAVERFNLGRTTTHEVGHWLNLRHIWGDVLGCAGDDFVSDTPSASEPNYGVPEFPHVTCNNGPNGDMFTNYMDYVDDRIMCMFTPGQVARMQAALAGPRATLFTQGQAREGSAMLVSASGARGAEMPVWEGWEVEMDVL